MSTTHDYRASLRDWVHQRVGPVDDGTPLLEDRLLNSLQIVELVLLIEELTGRPLDQDCLVPASFRDIHSICNCFFGDQAGQENAS